MFLMLANNVVMVSNNVAKVWKQCY